MSGRSRIVAAAADDDVAGTAAAAPVAVIVVAGSVHLASAIWRLSSIRMRIMPAPGASALPRLRPGTASCGPCACPFCRCSQSAAGSDNCQLGAILQCDSGSRDNNNTGNGQKKPHHLFPFVCPRGGHQQGGPNNVYALVCAHFQCNFAAPRTPLLPRTKVCNSHWQTAPLCYLATVHLTNTNSLAPAPGTAAPSPCSAAAAAADCGDAGDAHLKTTIINCLFLPGYWTTWPPSRSATN